MILPRPDAPAGSKVKITDKYDPKLTWIGTVVKYWTNSQNQSCISLTDWCDHPKNPLGAWVVADNDITQL